MGTFLRNIKESINDKSPMSVNSITLLASAAIGVIIGLVICFVLVYDVTYDGAVDTDLLDLGIFLLCSGGYILGSGVPKTIIDSRLKTKVKTANDDLEFEAEERRKRKRKESSKDDEE